MLDAEPVVERWTGARNRAHARILVVNIRSIALREQEKPSGNVVCLIL